MDIPFVTLFTGPTGIIEKFTVNDVGRQRRVESFGIFTKLFTTLFRDGQRSFSQSGEIPARTLEASEQSFIRSRKLKGLFLPRRKEDDQRLTVS